MKEPTLMSDGSILFRGPFDNSFQGSPVYGPETMYVLLKHSKKETAKFKIRSQPFF